MTAAHTLPEFDAQPLCAETDPELFFPEKGGSVTEAVAICRRCELRDPCLAYAVRHHVDGVWGGASEFQRQMMRRKLGIRAIRLQSTIAQERAEAARRMHARGTSTTEIARHLDVTVEAVNRILRGAA